MNRLALAAVFLGLAVGARAEEAEIILDDHNKPMLTKKGNYFWMGPISNARATNNAIEFSGLVTNKRENVPLQDLFEWGILWNGDGTGQIVVRRRQ